VKSRKTTALAQFGYGNRVAGSRMDPSASLGLTGPLGFITPFTGRGILVGEAQ